MLGWPDGLERADVGAALLRVSVGGRVPGLLQRHGRVAVGGQAEQGVLAGGAVSSRTFGQVICTIMIY